MRLEVRPDLTPEQRAALFDAALPDVRAELLAGATSITAEADGEHIVIKSDRLDAPKVVPVRGTE